MGVDRLSEGASAEMRTEPASPCVEVWVSVGGSISVSESSEKRRG